MLPVRSLRSFGPRLEVMRLAWSENWRPVSGPRGASVAGFLSESPIRYFPALRKMEFSIGPTSCQISFTASACLLVRLRGRTGVLNLSHRICRATGSSGAASGPVRDGDFAYVKYGAI